MKKSRGRPPGAAPPRLAQLLLRLCLRDRASLRFLLGDLVEEHSQALERRGRLYACLWYWFCSLEVIARYLWDPPPASRKKRRSGMLDELRQNFRYAIRGWRRSPGFAVVSLLTLTLGIGATTAIFSLADSAVLRKPLAGSPEELANVYTTCRRGFPRCSSSYPDYLDYRRRSTRFQDLAGYSWLPASIGDSESQSRMSLVQLVTGNYFALLQVGAHMGRVIEPSDDVAGSTAVVISSPFWARHFASDPAVLGRVMRINGVPFTIVGVASMGFQGTDLGNRSDVFISLRAGSQLNFGAVSDPGVFEERGTRWISALIGRLAPGATLEQAGGEMLSISGQLAQEDSQARGPRSVTVDSAARLRLPLGSEEDLVGLVMLLGVVVAFSLLLTCANLANLQLARAVARMRETGIRLCLGAARVRLMRQLLTENLLMAALGGVGGLLVAAFLIQLLNSFELPGGIAIGSLGIELNTRIFLFAAGVSMLTAALFGWAPAFQATRVDLMRTLRGDRSSSKSSHLRLRKSLLAIQLAVCLVLLVGSGLFLTTLSNGLATDLGFPAENLALARFNLSLLRYSPEQAMRFVEEAQERASSFPGVEAVGLATRVPLQPFGSLGTIASVPGYDLQPDEELRVEYVLVTPDYFRSLGLPLVWGREFGPSDRVGAPQVAVINQGMADRYWPGQSPEGRRFRIGEQEFQVVGICRNTNWDSLSDQSVSFVFLPLAQSPSSASSRFLNLIARTKGDPSAVLASLNQLFFQLDRQLALERLETMRSRLDDILMPQRLGAFFLTGFGLLSMTLAIVGVYGIVSYLVNERRRDIGIQIALGASGREVLGWLLKGILIPVGLGLLVGVAVAFGLSSGVESFMFGISAQDPTTFFLIVVLLGAVASMASFVPARRAARLDPVKVLRGD